MTRATRSQTVQSPNNKHDHLHPSKKLKESKKRKRLSTASEPDDAPPAKQQKNGLDEDHPIDLTLDESDALGILEVLEEIDTQGLLDRVFPVNSRESTSTSNVDANTYSLRALLQNPSQHDVRQLRTAVEPLYPISLHPRARLSDTAKQQRDFCDQALQLLDEATRRATQRVSFDKVTVLPESENEDQVDPPPSRRYALMQKLPSGEYWTSIDTQSRQIERSSIKEADTGYAQRVAILPSMPPSLPNPPTLGTYETFKRTAHKFKPIQLQPRTVSRGSFLDYGSFASFAPSWDSEGSEVGRNAMGLVLEAANKRKRLTRLRQQIKKAKPAPISLAPESLEASTTLMIADSTTASETIDTEMTDFDSTAAANVLESPLSSLSGTPNGSVIDANIEDDDIFAKTAEKLVDEKKPSEDDSAERFAEMMEVEQRVADLLKNNAVALTRLQYLQAKRLIGKDVSHQTEMERKTASALFDSLSTVVELRPRMSAEDHDSSAIMPSLSRLRAVHRTLPAERQNGWLGTLAEARTAALRDDTTVTAKANVQVAPKVSTPSTPQATPSYRSPFSYYPVQGANGQTGYYQTPYPSTNYTSQTPGQTPYPYTPGWGYTYPVTPSGQKGTPPGFPSYFPIQSPALQRAVANTAKPAAATNGWPTGSALPPHLRRQPTQQTPTKPPSQQAATQ